MNNRKNFIFYLSILVLSIILTSLPVLAANQGFTIAGEIYFIKTGPIHIHLHASEAELNHKEPCPFELVIHLTPEDIKTKKAPFKFENVPHGNYAIGCFQDVNQNQEFDLTIFGPEPWGVYLPLRPFLRAPKFTETAFPVDKDIQDIQIVLK